MLTRLRMILFITGVCMSVLPAVNAAAQTLSEPTTQGVRQSSVMGTMAPMRANAPSKVALVQPQSLYVLHCAGCHGMDGRGHSQAQVPDLHGMAVFFEKTGGREFLIRVPGVMGSGLNDEEVAVVMNWVVQRYLTAEQAKGVPPFDAEEIHRARQSPLTDVMKTRQKLLEPVVSVSAR